MKGTIKMLNGTKRFGFITGTDGKDYFFHQSDFNGEFSDLIEGTMNGPVEVSFQANQTEKGPRAAEVTRL